MFRDLPTDIVRKTKKRPKWSLKMDKKSTRSHLSLARLNRTKYAEDYISLRGKHLPLRCEPLIVPTNFKICLLSNFYILFVSTNEQEGAVTVGDSFFFDKLLELYPLCAVADPDLQVSEGVGGSQASRP